MNNTSLSKTVANINRLTGRETVSKDLTQKDFDNIGSQVKIVLSEVQELTDHWEQKDLDGVNKMRDDIGDILFTVMGLGHVLGYPVDDDLRLICESQFTKFDIDEEGAAKTKQKYLDLGVETYQLRKRVGSAEDNNFWIVTKSAKDQMGTDGKDYPKDKWLKSTRFKEPHFDPFYNYYPDVSKAG